MRLIELTEPDGGILLINTDNISEITGPRTFEASGANAVITMVSGNRHAVRETPQEIAEIAK